MTEEVIGVAADGIAAGIATLGAELRYLRDGDGRDLLWDGDPAFWTGRAPLLFPIVGGLRNDRYRYAGRSYTLPKHGFARTSRFRLIEHFGNAATFRLAADDATRAAYPFTFRLDVCFALADRAITITATLANFGDEPMPASFGFHPALCWPLPYGRGRADHRLTFTEPEAEQIRRIDAAGLVEPEPRPTPVSGDTLMLDDSLFVDDAIIFDRLASRRLTYGAAHGPRLAIDFPDMPMLGVWTKPGAGYICIEPWQGIADPAGFDGDIFAKPGIITVEQGESREFAMRIALVGD